MKFLPIYLSVSHVKKLLSQMNISWKTDSDNFLCEPCIQEKHARSFSKLSSSLASKAGELIHADLNGPMEQKSLGGSSYFFTPKR